MRLNETLLVTDLDAGKKEATGMDSDCLKLRFWRVIFITWGESLGLNKLRRRKQRKGKHILRHCLNPQIHPFLKPEITMNFPNKWVRQLHFLDKIVWAAITTTEKEIGKMLNPNLCHSRTEAQRHSAAPCHWMSYCARISLVKMLPWEVINN